MITGSWFDQIPEEPGPQRDAWLAARGWEFYEEWLARGEDQDDE